jgi:N-methylhydantoinase B
MVQTDPVLNEVIQSALDLAVEEGGFAAARAAGSTFVSSSNGIACALFDASGRQVAQTAGGLLHVSALRSMLPNLLARFPVEGMKDGDVYIFNDHFLGGIHPTDVGAFRPIYHGGRLVYFAATMMIVSDLGGMSAGGLPANATEIFHEGLVIPPVPYHQAGELIGITQQFIRSNSRAPDKVIGDIDALVAGTAVVKARMGELLDRYGIDVVEQVVEQLLAYTVEMTRLGLSEFPDGVYQGAYAVEEDGIEADREFVVRCTIEISGADCLMDFTGTDRQARGPINASYSQALSAAIYAIRCFLDHDIPMNEGFYDAVKVRLPEGSLVNPVYPAAANLRMGTVTAMLDAVNGALSAAFPGRVGAPGSVAATATVSGVSAESGSTWTMLDANFGASGGRQGLDGTDGTPSPIYSSAGWERSIEAYEWEFPVQYECFKLLPDTAGPGQWRGAAGVMKTMHFETDGWLTVRSSDRFARAPLGLAGGHSGSGGAWLINMGRADETRLPSKKTNHFLKAGERLTFINAGGGGFGDPHLRAVEDVARDVRHGFVTREGALRDYAVEIDAEGNARRGGA